MATNEVIFGNQTLISLKNDTVTPETMLSGTTAHDKAGNEIVGTIESYSGSYVIEATSDITLPTANKICTQDITVRAGSSDAFAQLLNGTITTAVVPSSVTKLREYAFYNCEHLEDLQFEGDVTSIETRALSGTTSLENFTIPNTVRSIAQYAFTGSGITTATIPEGVETIASRTFEDCAKLSNVTIPTTVQTIEAYAFRNCTRLLHTSFAEGLISIGQYAFDSAGTQATSPIGIRIYLPASLQTIQAYAFKSNTLISAITFNGKPTSIATTAFSSCSNLRTITCPWANGAVSGAPWGATSATIRYTG